MKCITVCLSNVLYDPQRHRVYVLLSSEEWDALLDGSMGTAPGGSKIGWGTIRFIHVTTLSQKKKKSQPIMLIVFLTTCIYVCSCVWFRLSIKIQPRYFGLQWTKEPIKHQALFDMCWCVRVHVERKAFCTHFGGNWGVSTSDSSSDKISTTGMWGRGSKS